jgi:hypothetical protein
MTWYTILTNLVAFEIDMRTYRQALTYLDHYANYELNRAVQYSPETFNLSRIEQLLDRLGNPHREFKSVHVAGTKGKGSTCRMIESVLSAAGYRTGLFTSPHLHTFRERIQVGRGGVSHGKGEAISSPIGVTPPLLIGRDEVAALVDELEPHIAAVPGLTYFEIVTAMGFLTFARQRVEMAVIEVGLGGRLDATNVVTPRVSVITSLSYDHTAWLGNTLAQIAFEKAGIIGRCRPCPRRNSSRHCKSSSACAPRPSRRWCWWAATGFMRRGASSMTVSGSRACGPSGTRALCHRPSFSGFRCRAGTKSLMRPSRCPSWIYCAASI